jgi:hypothetical protein
MLVLKSLILGMLGNLAHFRHLNLWLFFDNTALVTTAGKMKDAII